MKKALIFILFLVSIFVCPKVAAEEEAPRFVPQDAVIFYEVPDQILMCQNKQEDMVKGAAQFEKTLKKYYQKRFNIISIERIFITPTEDGKYPEEEKKKLFETAKEALPILVKIDLLGNGTATDTYQNAFGAQQSITVPTTTIWYGEAFGYAEDNMFWGWTNTLDYRPPTFALFGEVFAKKQDNRVLTKNAVEAYIRDVNTFNPPNKYTAPLDYEHYLAIYLGNAKKLGDMNKSA